MSEPLVTIIIPNYNYGHFLGAAIRSALDQTYPNIEVIVVDDGSTDDSRGVIESFGSRIQAIFQENQGQSASNLRGWHASKGDIVLFLDADDALRPDAVASVVKAMKPNVASVQFCLMTIDQNAHALGGIYPPLPPDWSPARIRETLLRSGFYPFPPTSGNAYARWFLERILPFDVSRYRRGTDGLLAAVAPLYGDVVVLMEPLGYYRIHGENMGALETLNSSRFRYFVELDLKRAEFLSFHAERTGAEVPRDFLDRAFFHLQYRLASKKLGPREHPYREDSLGKIYLLLLRAAWVAPEPALTRAFVCAWGLGVALAPRQFAEQFVAARFIAGQRPRFLDGLLRRLGLVRRRGRQGRPVFEERRHPERRGEVTQHP